MKPILLGLIAAGSFMLATANVQAHVTFKKELAKKYPGMKVSCNACHVKDKPKTERNEFGKLLYEEFKDKKLTADFKSKKGEDRKKFEKDVMIPAFTKALEKVKKLKPKDNEKTYDELIKLSLIHI